MADEELAALHVFAKQVAVKMRKVIPCQRIGVAVIGLEVPHAHVHLVPMDAIADLDFSKPRVKLTKEEFAETAASIRDA